MYDIIVVGGGTSGLMAAVQAAEYGAKVLIIEKNGSLGRKLLLTGGGRCNVTNNRPSNEIIAHIPGNGKFLYSAFSQFDNYDIMSFFTSNGVTLKEEDHGRMFPTTDKARTILETFQARITDLHIDVWYDCSVKKLLIVDGTIKGVRLANGKDVSARCVILATGGKSVPKTGSTGDAYAWLKKASHTITPLFPTEVPLTSNEPFIQQKILQGLSLRGIGLSVLNEKGKAIVTHEMDMIFTHFGVSGPAVLRCSSFVYHQQQKTQHQNVTLSLDCCTTLSKEQLTTQLHHIQKTDGAKQLKTVLKTFIPERLALFYAQQLNLDANTALSKLDEQTIHRIATLLKHFTFTVNGSLPIEKSFVTGGGVSVKEISPQTMMSKYVDGLFCCGELLDIHGYTGGYNITSAFITGTIAGRSAAMYFPQ
ncbi:NAD(P)/FAD-dependent oxidoreductase [Carnobacteriaceae bacterium zg-ZUI252]|nr:NAD(P)/FAD-dependent oxidoreductase [Carnobacteriaceae bacterium zg-ZUI252]MBS4769577.1 NAD(P)/FAD-dependent oxidoreductase [Carnobacteriaceae bacterium zg-ZUI240]QTU83042.1 NAD(P)/FAD-dependent oxidoreductase [Carnobacteriaceae bacterium zg-C25]